MPVDPPLEQPRYPDLAGKIAVVTGGSRGIGAATARALAANGAAVAVVGRDEDALAAVTDDIQARGGQALLARADCTIEAEISRAAHTITTQVGLVDILAAFAGGNGMPAPTAKETAAHWREVIESDLDSCRWERVDAGHPFRHLGVGIGGGPVAPLAQREQQQQQHPARSSPTRSCRRRCCSWTGCSDRRRVGDAAEDREREHPSQQEHRAVDPRAGRTASGSP
jgi:NAD(P)-dependent dehydrogenase (short-subunit alcohol dehydrogenase family)